MLEIDDILDLGLETNQLLTAYLDQKTCSLACFNHLTVPIRVHQLRIIGPQLHENRIICQIPDPKSLRLLTLDKNRPEINSIRSRDYILQVIGSQGSIAVMDVLRTTRLSREMFHWFFVGVEYHLVFGCGTLGSGQLELVWFLARMVHVGFFD
jgi:hypothetical protein